MEIYLQIYGFIMIYELVRVPVVYRDAEKIVKRVDKEFAEIIHREFTKISVIYKV